MSSYSSSNGSTPPPPSTLPASERRSKRTRTTTKPPPPPTFDTDDEDEDDQEGSDDDVYIEEHVDKKPRRPLGKKGAVSLPTKEEKAANLPRFPPEILDMIISIDSDLDLRDHVALAGTCRFFRTCYRDVVFQVLLQAAFPKVNRFCDQILVSRDGELIPHVSPSFSTDPRRGPFSRGYNAGRRIFSSGRSLVGAGGWDGWGLSRLEFEANIEEANKQKAELEEALRQHWDERPIDTTEDPDRWASTLAGWPVGRVDGLSEEALQLEKESHFKDTMDSRRRFRGYRRDRLQLVHDLGPDLIDPEYRFSHLRPSKSDLERRDPWPSSWRQRACLVVLNPTIDRASAKKQYGLTDRDLKGLKQKLNLGGRNYIYYYTAAVEALAICLRSPSPEETAYLAKLKATREKAEATRNRKGIFTAKK